MEMNSKEAGEYGVQSDMHAPLPGMGGFYAVVSRVVQLYAASDEPMTEIG